MAAKKAGPSQISLNKSPTTTTQGKQPVPKPFTFKGHPQPPVDERLYAAKNFLADEDPDRCLNFDTKLVEVEELVAQIEKDNDLCDPELFRDVKVKLKVHRDWEARRKTSPYDIGCCEAPLIAPFSTRLISADTAADLRQERESQGLAIQMRNDHAPFSVNLEDDHSAFLARMREDAATDPDEVNHDSNLLWKESRAYLWATRDPALIPYWMHPRSGIPTKGVEATNRGQLHDPNSATRSDPMPSRGWIPAYITATEKEINRLLQVEEPSPDEFSQLQALLRPYQPRDLQTLRERHETYIDAAALDSLSNEREADRIQNDAEFESALQSWLNDLIMNGVYFIICTSGDPEIVQPGVFYINDGVMTPEHINTLKGAQVLLDKLLQSSRTALTEQEAASLDSLLQHSLPKDILDTKKQMSQILLLQGANYVSDLDQENLPKFLELQEKEEELQLRWEDALKQSGGAEFRYLRPAEMDSNKRNILYLPWEVTAIPQTPLQARPDLELPKEIQKLQDDVNDGLGRNIDLADIDNGSLKFRQLLEQLVYQDLRDLLTPYFALKLKDESVEQQLDQTEREQYDAIAAVVPALWKAWWRGLGKKITIKMPRRAQQNKTPGVMYCRNPTKKPAGEELETYFTRKAAEINDLLPRYHAALDQSNDEAQGYLEQLQELCDDLQYPALQKLEEEYVTAYKKDNVAEGNKYLAEWNEAFYNWMQSKKGHSILIITPNGYIDPDDDPSVVYYRGPVLHPENFPGLAEDIKNTIREIQSWDQPTLPEDLRPQLPPLLQRLMEVNDKSKTPEAQAVLDWHLQAFMPASDLSSPISSTTNRPTSQSSRPTSLTSSVSGNVSTDEEESLIRRIPSRRTAFKYYQLKTNLALLLPDIRAVESEINRLLDLFGESIPPFQDASDVIELVPNQLDLHNRLTELLKQFWPDHVFQRWQRGKRYTSMFSILGADASQISDQEYADAIAAYKEDFLKTHNTWLTELMSTGVQVQISAREVYTTDKTILVFQPGISLRPTGRHGDPSFCVVAPETITESGVQTSKLVCKASTFSNAPISYNFGLVEYLAQKERDINKFLKKRASTGLTWQQSETLLSNLRPFMSPDLVELDKDLRELDEKARKKTLNEPELGNWYQMWAAWDQMYNFWLDGFPSKGIVIDKKDEMEDLPGSLRLQIENPWSLPDYKRPTNLPLHLKRHEDLMNSLSSTPDILNDSERAYLDQLLAPLFRPTLKNFRRLALEHVQKICKRAARDPEDDALMETLISLAHSILEEAVFMSTAARRIQIREQVPGAYEVIVVNSSNNPTFPTSEANENDLAEGMFRQLCASHLEASKIEFHDTAFWIRTEKNLGQGAANFLQHNIPNISSQHILALRTRVLEIMSSNGSGEAEKDQAQKDLAQAITRLCWKQLMMMHPDQDKKILDLIGTPTLSIRTPALVARRLQGASPLAPPPLVIPPSEADIKAVEIEINNLIRAVKSNPVDKELGEKLCYLLRALLPPRLRFLKSRIEILDAQYLARDGLGIMDSLQFADAQKQFEPLFQLWQQSITGLGIVLDNWLSTPEAISEVCSRARQWRVFNFGPDSGIISDKLEDGDVQQCQEIYAAFRRFVEYGCQDGDGVDDQILLRSTPADVRYQIKQIQKRILLAQEVTNDEKKTQYAMVLHTLQVQLMKSYMRWLTSLTPMRRQTFRGQIRGNYDSSTNFTPKAERRGIKRAAVELALNLLATNQEQHRPKDRFRMVDLPSQVQLPEREVALCLPLKPEDRPLEQDPLEYTKKMLAFRRWKDYDYGIARVRSSTDQNGELPPPENFNGPTSIASVDNVHAAARTQITDLALIQKGLIEAQNTAPRPLIEQLLLLTDAGLNYTEEQDHALYDDELLKSDGVDLLEEIAGASWDEERREYGEEIPGVQNTPDARGRLEEFERDLAELSKQLPPWQPDVDPDAMDEDGFELFLQPDYDPEILSEHGMLIGQVRQIIGNNRLAKSSSTAGTSPPLNSNDVTRYLKAMASARRIHIDEYDNGDIYVSKIPLSGHPENKYVVSREEAPTSAGVYREKDGKLQVRYDSFGRVGPPILQPNKYHYLRVLAFRLGRDLRKNAEVLANPERGLGERVQEQQTSRSLAEKEMENILPADRSGGAYITNLVDPPQRNITLQRMAQDLLKIAPDLAQEAGFRIASPTDITEQQAAILLQMQLLEEANNNWEWKFPENEHVWDFAAVRLEKTTRIINGRSIEGRPRLAQYFHMRRFAPCYLSEATKTIIKASGPTIQEEPVPTEMTDEHDADPGEKKVRHIKGREPYFSLGESAYERAFLSWRMEQELKEIPEFQRPKKRRSWWSFGKGNKDDDDQDLPKDRYPLPKIPAHWIPDSVSIAQKRAHVLELAKEDEAFPNPEILEYFHTPAEIQQINIQRQWDLFAMKRQVADAAVEQHTGKKFDRLSQEELNKAYKELGINQLNGIFNDDPKSVPIDNKKRTAQQAAPAGTMKLRKRGGREIRTAVI